MNHFFRVMKFDTVHWDLCDFKRLDDGASLVVVDVDGAVVEPSEQPRLGWVEIDALDTVRDSEFCLR